jgi:Cu(I)/Ag(I) efflux system membrane protein CusA/SilA
VIARLIAFSVRHKLLVILATLAAMAGAAQVLGTIRLDALPDLSDTQVIVLSRWERAPSIIEDQVTYPIITALLGAPRVKAVRGFSDFGVSYVYVVFEDGTDIYWARSRVLEYLAKIEGQLPAGVQTELGPDATGVGWVYQYALVDRSGTHTLADLRAMQDWNLRYALQSVPGVSEVAAIGGYGRELQITPDPNRLVAYGLSIDELAMAVRASNDEGGGRLVEWGGAEHMVRVRGYAQTPADLEQVVVRLGPGGVPVRLGEVARIAWGPEPRRGVADLDGKGDHVGGIVVMRHGENAKNVIRRVERRLAELERSLPAGVEIVPTYDRSVLIDRAIDTLRHELLLQMVVVTVVILIFLWHIPSAIVPILTIPISVLLSFIPLYFFGITVNIMSLAGIAISIGVLVDGAIVEVENAYNRLYEWQANGKKGDPHLVRLQALQEVGPSVFFSLLVIAVAFLPIFALVEQEGRLFGPLAWSKNLAMALAALLAVTLDPALRMLFVRMEPFEFRPRWLARLATGALVGTYYAEERHPISRAIHRVYEPICRATLRRPKTTIGIAVLILLASLPMYRRLGHEFMPPLHEGTILFMPTTLPGLSVTEAQRLLETQDRVLASFPEVERVFGKAGRAETATDPAPFSMMETTVVLRPESEWRARPTWYSNWAPEWLRGFLRPFWPDHITYEELVDEMDQALRIPGVTNAWTMPIKARIDMLSTGIRTPIGVKILGNDLATLERVGAEIEAALRDLPGTRSVFAERTAGGYFLDIEPSRERLARYGLRVADVQNTVAAALGGEKVSTVIDGRARYPITVRYPRELREDLDQLGRVLITAPLGSDGMASGSGGAAGGARVQQVPLAQVADLRLVQGPAMIRNEDGFLAGYVFVDVAGRDIGSYVEAARARVTERVSLPAGTNLVWSGQYENMLRVRERLKVVVPITIALIFVLLLANTGSAFKALLVLAVVPFSAIGAIWLFDLLDYNVSIAAWVGMIALLGLDAETAVFMLMFLDHSLRDAKAAGRLNTQDELDEALVHGAVKRVRPKLMTVATAFIGLVPILFAAGAGADVMRRIAAPMIGGLVTSFLAELLLYPAAYKLWWGRRLGRVDEPDPAHGG